MFYFVRSKELNKKKWQKDTVSLETFHYVIVIFAIIIFIKIYILYIYLYLYMYYL